MMFIKFFPTSTESHKEQLKKLTSILEVYPRSLSEHFLYGMDIPEHHKKEFNAAFDQLYTYYRQGIDEYGWDAFLQQVRVLEPTILFMAEGKEEEDYKRRIILQVLYSDLRHYFYRVDDFVTLKDADYKVHKALFLNRDKYNMVDVDKHFVLKRQGIVYDDENLIFYHPFLRRFFGANFTEITTCITQLSKLKNCQLQLAIDPFRITSKASYKEIFEADFWRGPKFSDTKLNDPAYVGKSIYKRLPENQKITEIAIDRIETVVKQDGLNKEFSIEEITIPLSKLNEDLYSLSGKTLKYSDKFRLNKFAHFIWNSEKKCFSHLDVAVIVHDLHTYEDRFLLEHPSRDAVKKVDKIKLVRVDGEIPLESVENLCTDFYRYNELIGEFFAGK